MAVLSPQIQAERDQKSNAVLRAEIMNKALQTQVQFFLEPKHSRHSSFFFSAETSARHSREIRAASAAPLTKLTKPTKRNKRTKLHNAAGG